MPAFACIYKETFFPDSSLHYELIINIILHMGTRSIKEKLNKRTIFFFMAIMRIS